MDTEVVKFTVKLHCENKKCMYNSDYMMNGNQGRLHYQLCIVAADGFLPCLDSEGKCSMMRRSWKE